MPDHLRPWTKEDFEHVKRIYEAAGYTVQSRWRPGLKHIRLNDVVLSHGTAPGDGLHADERPDDE